LKAEGRAGGPHQGESSRSLEHRPEEGAWGCSACVHCHHFLPLVSYSCSLNHLLDEVSQLTPHFPHQFRAVFSQSKFMIQSTSPCSRNVFKQYKILWHGMLAGIKDQAISVKSSTMTMQSPPPCSCVLTTPNPLAHSSAPQRCPLP
jgi:hypothetical protein